MSNNKGFSDTSANRYSLALYELASDSNLLKNIEKNSFFDEEINNDEDFDFNQDFEIEEGTRSPGWIRYQKRIK